jgi:autotransporter translocation and assembly factor TamB
MPRDRPIPLSLSGIPYGMGWGRVQTNVQLEDRVVRVRVALPTFQVMLAERDPARVETLDPNPAVTVLQPLGPPPRASVPGEERSYVVEIDLGDQVSLRRGDMRLEVTGNPIVYVSEETRVEGNIRVTGGYFSVSGRRFVIDRGIIQFAGNPSDPSLDIEATYRSQDGSRITAMLGGSLKDARIELSSDPPRSQSEIVSLLLFGDRVAPGQVNVPGAGLSQATGVADQPSAPGGGALVLGINELLYQSALPVQTQLTSTPYSTRASAAVELGDRVRLEYTRQFGAQAYGQQLDANLVELDWRFAMRWVLRTIVGDRGTTSLDVLWQRWY